MSQKRCNCKPDAATLKRISDLEQKIRKLEASNKEFTNFVNGFKRAFQGAPLIAIGAVLQKEVSSLKFTYRQTSASAKSALRMAFEAKRQINPLSSRLGQAVTRLNRVATTAAQNAKIAENARIIASRSVANANAATKLATSASNAAARASTTAARSATGLAALAARFAPLLNVLGVLLQLAQFGLEMGNLIVLGRRIDAVEAQNNALSKDLSKIQGREFANKARLDRAVSDSSSALLNSKEALANSRDALLKAKPGPQGKPGIQGKPGPQGIQGIQGARGPQGSPGINGKNGVNGKDAVLDPSVLNQLNRIETAVNRVPRSTCTYNPALDIEINRTTKLTDQKVGWLQTAVSGIGTMLSGVNTFLSGTVMGTVNTINSKLGAPLVGGISGYLQTMQGFAQKAWEMTRMDKVLGALTFMVTLHNAAMLSRSLAETLGELASQFLNTFVLRDHTDNPIDVNQIVGQQVNSLMSNLLGADVWAGLKASWNRANRIISTASNVVWSIRSIMDSSREISEWIAEHTGKIGNALKRWRVVGENAYGWMPEKVTAQSAWDRKVANFRAGVENLDDAASSFGSVVGEVGNILEESNQLLETSQRFATELESATPKDRPVNMPVYNREETSKANSVNPAPISTADIEKGDPP